MSGKIIEIKNVHKSFKENNVLTGVNLSVEEGSIYALLGSNGAGKTTLIKIMSTLLRSDCGNVNVNGFDIENDPDNVRKSISLTGQFAAVDEVLTGRENIEMMIKLRHLKKSEVDIDSLLKRFDIYDDSNRRVGLYSGGMKRKIDIAMSIVGNPKIIFLDEPTTGLDPEARLEVWKIINELVASGTTVFLTTQYLDEAEQLAHRIGILHQGTIIVEGTLEELKKLLPPIKVEYVEKKPTLEEIFLAIVGNKEVK